MKKHLISFALGALTFMCIGATIVDNIMTVKPAVPKSVFAITCEAKEAVSYIGVYTKKGYIVKSFTSGAHYDYDCVLIMEKY